MSKQKIVGLESGDVSIVSFLNEINVDLKAKEHLDYRFQCCEKRSSHSSHTCEHGMMDLVIEAWKDPDNRSDFNVMVVSMAHYGEMNGDLMRDPDVVFKVYQMGNDIQGNPIVHVRMVSYRNDYVGVFQESMKYGENGEILVSKKLQKEQKSFLLQFIRNVKAQKYTPVRKVEA